MGTRNTAVAILMTMAIAITATLSASARSLPTRRVQNETAANLAAKKQQNTAQARMLVTLANQIGKTRTKTWNCQNKLGVARTRAATSVLGLPRSVAYRTWVASRWNERSIRCEQMLRERTIPHSRDWRTSVDLVQRIYPGTRDWLLYISRREGGWGHFKMNYQGSGAGGWMQFMHSTYTAYADDAFADARARGFVIDPRANSWYDPMGQAITAAYMRYTGRDGCHWCL